MKWILSLMIVIVSTPLLANANCRIDFENEISANRTTHNLFRHIRANKSLLVSKGYSLVSAAGPIPMFSGFIQVDDFNSSVLSISVYKMDSPNAWSSSVKFQNSATGVRSLLKKLPTCKKFKI